MTQQPDLGAVARTIIEIFSRRSQAHGTGERARADVLAPGRLRLYRGTASEAFVLDRRDQRIPVSSG